jgi:DNA-directed RNA polymerase subunit RPC12/RpoP
MEDQMIDKSHEISNELNCKDCGAVLKFSPGTQSLACQYCGAQNEIPKLSEEIVEIDFEEFIKNKAGSEEKQTVAVVKCNNCGASTTLQPNIISDVCPFCASPVVVKDGTTSTIIKPKYVLPFKIDDKNAHTVFQKWLHGLWFAPNDLKKLAAISERLKGLYMPYWTYDAQTVCNYVGQRGDHYYNTQSYSTMVNGKSQMRTRQVQNTRWSFKSGTVQNVFDDVCVLASKSLPEATTRNLEPWDVKNFSPFNEGFLSGFQTECYQVEVQQGFEIAKSVMEQRVRATVCKDIGGNEQRVNQMHVDYSSITFKHVLLPIWISAYRYNNKVYRFIINGRSGKVQGERPYSKAKIAALVIGILVAIATLYMARGG